MKYESIKAPALAWARKNNYEFMDLVDPFSCKIIISDEAYLHIVASGHKKYKIYPNLFILHAVRRRSDLDKAYIVLNRLLDVAEKLKRYLDKELGLW